MNISVVVADGQALVRAGLLALLHAASGIEVVGEAADGRQAVHLATALHPDVVLMDVRMPRLDGIAATRLIVGGHAHRGPRVLMLTACDAPEYVSTALGAGASGFVLKDTPPERLVSAVRTVAAGDMLITPVVTRELVETYTRHHRALTLGLNRLGPLTTRETDVLRLVAAGLGNAEIAARLGLSAATVKTHVKRVMQKLGVNSRAQAVVLAYESGLVVPRGRVAAELSDGTSAATVPTAGPGGCPAPSGRREADPLRG
ncbi:response regulator [Streptomyces bohaiensis]|uniref:Response regulator transcription factor n=1 Tax=Streptomyces bohaiensis TaxID=1431344 RepID=A0ABX1CCJ5_9ACTN|nr:response regulator transcription factor [Streptomyces bohaiensis]NJQ16831.1 response regulator transcription factor [Streptomyces bohaiensis]